MKATKEDLEKFLIYVKENCTDSYGHLEVVISDDAKEQQDYYSQTPKGIVEEFLAKNK